MTQGSPAAHILRLAVWIMPQKRRSWAAAMAAEFHHLPQGHMAFALGCLWSALMSHLTSVRDLGRFGLLALIGLAFLASVSGTLVSAAIMDWHMAQALWLLAWIAPLPLLLVQGWRQSARLTPLAAACLLAGGIGMALVLAFPHTDLAQATGTAPAVLALCAALALAAARLTASAGRI